MSDIDTKNYLEGDAKDSNIAGNDVNINQAQGNINQGGADVVGGDKITHIHYHNEPPKNETPVIADLSQPPKLTLTELLKQNWKKTLAVVLGLAVVSASGWQNYFSKYAEQLDEGQTYLNMGLYSEAQNAFQQAINEYPFHRFAAAKEAEWGLEKTKVFDSKNSAMIETKLKQFEKNHPDDADVQTFYGKFYLTFQKFTEAEQHYKKAIQLNPKAVEAHSGLCEIYNLKNTGEALTACENALKFSVGTPNNYTINLAMLYAQISDYDSALDLLGKIENKSLLGKFERSKLFLITNQLPKAEQLQEQTLNGLNDVNFANLPENRVNWYFKATENAITLTNIEDKKCYVNYSLAASFYLLNDQNRALQHLQKATDLCGVNNEEIKQQLLFDLKLAEKNGLPTKSVEEFKKLFATI